MPRSRVSLTEPAPELSASSPAEAAAEMARTGRLVALLPPGAVTLDSLIKLAAGGRLHAAKLAEAVVDLPRVAGRAGAVGIASSYALLGSKYALAPGGALTPRSVYSAAREALPPAEVAASATPPAIVAPNATLKGALRRMLERGSICAFVVRAGRLKGVVDAWTALLAAVEEGERGLDAPCGERARREPVVGSYAEAAEALCKYGFAAMAAGGAAVMVDDISLHRSLLAARGRWLRSLGGRR